MNAIIALNPGQMAEAQTTTISWVDAKLAAANKEMADAEATFNALNGARLDVRPATRMMDKAGRRIRFYEKVKAALDAGYYIVPPFPLDLFALRVDRSPNADVGTTSWQQTKAVPPRLLPVGEGRYVDPRLPRLDAGTKPEVRGNETREIQLYRNGDWYDVELPVRALKPQVIEATGKALQERIFDALGIAPAYRSADPIICGRILHPDGKRALTFFVAWWLDEADL